MPCLRRPQRPGRVTRYRCDPGGHAGPHGDSVRVVTCSGLDRVEQSPRRLDVTVQRSHLRQHPCHEQLQIPTDRILVVPREVGEQCPLDWLRYRNASPMFPISHW